MMQYKVTVSPKSGENNGRWSVVYYNWNGAFGPDHHPIAITGWQADGEKKFSTTIELTPGQHILQADVVLGEDKVSVSLSPVPALAPPITQPWPLEVERSNATHAVGVRYFIAGDPA